jgi:hypothetical protein
MSRPSESYREFANNIVCYGKAGWGRSERPTIPRELATAKLSEQDLPAVDADEETIGSSARTLDGYKYVGSKPPISSDHPGAKMGLPANSAREEYFSSGKVALPRDLGDLRCCLFFKRTCLHHEGISADHEVRVYLHTLVESIRQKARAGEKDSAGSHPQKPPKVERVIYIVHPPR